MASLRNNETAVSDKNDSAKGPSGTRARSRTSLYMLVGGSSDVYDVTVNFETKNGHWCQKESGARCHGNGNGKGQKFGPPQGRDKHDPNQWCKHVKAALADVEGLAEAEERTARAFGERATVTIKPAVPAFEEPKAIKPATLKPAGDMRARLATLEAEKAAIVAALASEERINKLRNTVAALIGEHTVAEIEEALKYAAS
jgi:hypothetical protein